MNNLIWLHEDMLRTEHLVFEIAGSNPHSFFVWDEKRFVDAGINFKRLVFIYQTLINLPVTIYRGDTRDVVNKLSYKFGVSEVFTPDANSVSLRRTFDKLQYIVDLNIVEDAKLFRYNDEVEYTRFFQFWRAIENRVQLLNVAEQSDNHEGSDPPSFKSYNAIRPVGSKKVGYPVSA